MSMITIRNLQFQYDAAPEINALYGIDLEIRKGECVILTGESGCGKTTLTRCLNGLIPNFFEGTLTGEILYEGVPVNKMEQYELSRKIGTVFQDPRSQFFAVNTTDEVAFGCENLAFSTERINQNVDAAFSRMNIDVLRDRSFYIQNQPYAPTRQRMKSYRISAAQLCGRCQKCLWGQYRKNLPANLSN